VLARVPGRVGGRAAESVGAACGVFRRPSMPDLGISPSLTGEILFLWLDLRFHRLDGGGVFRTRRSPWPAVATTSSMPLAGFPPWWRFPFPHPPLLWVKTLTLRGGGGGSTSFPFSKAQSGAAWVVDEFLAVGGCVWQCFLSGDEPGLEVVGKAPIRW
jgi:hypothetical protein